MSQKSQTTLNWWTGSTNIPRLLSKLSFWLLLEHNVISHDFSPFCLLCAKMCSFSSDRDIVLYTCVTVICVSLAFPASVSSAWNLKLVKMLLFIWWKEYIYGLPSQDLVYSCLVLLQLQDFYLGYSNMDRLNRTLGILGQAGENQWICSLNNAVQLTHSSFQGAYTCKEINTSTEVYHRSLPNSWVNMNVHLTHASLGNFSC